MGGLVISSVEQLGSVLTSASARADEVRVGEPQARRRLQGEVKRTSGGQSVFGGGAIRAGRGTGW